MPALQSEISKVWCDYKVLAKLPLVGTRQFLDCHRKFVILTKHPSFKKEFRCSDKVLRKLKCSNLHNEARGLFFTCNPRGGIDSGTPNYQVIYIDHLIERDKRLLSVIVHEVSHAVDRIIHNAYIKKVDTEVRAYMLQYYVEHIFNMVDFSFPTQSLKGGENKGKKKNKKRLKLNKGKNKNG